MQAASPYQFKHDRFSSHAQIAAQLKQVLKMIDRSCVVLDVGCASGFLRNFLSQPKFYLIGIEREPELVAAARQQYDEVHQADLTADLDLSLQQPPDAVVLADVLEHLPYPESVLIQLLQEQIQPGTPVIISLPNVAHLVVRLSLLLGRFDYADRGILDRTHLRFYTLKTAKQLCRNCGIRLTAIRATPVPLPLVHPLFGEKQLLFPIHRLNALLASTFKGLLAYQVILCGVYEP
jgi:methionine biosynthesis protein MetW